MTSLNSSNILKPAKTKEDWLKKSKAITNIISQGSALTVCVSTILTALKIVSIGVLGTAFLPVPIACVITTLLIKLLPDSYAVIKKKLIKMQCGVHTEFEKSELKDIQVILNTQLDAISPRTDTELNYVQNSVPEEPVPEVITGNEPITPTEIMTNRTLYVTPRGSLFKKIHSKLSK